MTVSYRGVSYCQVSVGFPMVGPNRPQKGWVRTKIRVKKITLLSATALWHHHHHHHHHRHIFVYLEIVKHNSYDTVWLYFLLRSFNSVCCIYSFILCYRIKCWNKAVYNSLLLVLESIYATGFCRSLSLPDHFQSSFFFRQIFCSDWSGLQVTWRSAQWAWPHQSF